jgi:hypothetical protein
MSGERRFYVSLQPKPELMGWQDPESDGQVSGKTPRAAAISWAWDHEDEMSDAAGSEWVGAVALYLVEHDGDSLLGPVEEFSVEYEVVRQFASPKRVEAGHGR